MTAPRARPPGGLVALEGLSQEDLTVQLQLLPPSPHVLVLPRVEAYLEADDDDDAAAAAASCFDARRYVARVHAAECARRGVAMDFLSSSSSSSPRTVLLHGGTATSHALCIEAIRQHDPTVGGDLAQAARLFDEVVHGGEEEEEEEEDNDQDEDDEKTTFLASQADPITRAMQAADALDRETEGLQPSTHVLDLTIRPSPRRDARPRARSLDLPLHGAVLLQQTRPDSSPTTTTTPTVAASPTSLLFPASMRLDAQREMGCGRPRTREASTEGDTTGEEKRTPPKLRLETTSRQSSLPRKPLPLPPLPRSVMVQYMDRGTDALEEEAGDGDVDSPERKPLLPLVEDLVICFVDGRTTDDAAALELAVQRCRRQRTRTTTTTRTRTTMPLPSQDSQTRTALPATPTSGTATTTLTATTTDYDPFAPHQYNAVVTPGRKQAPPLPPARTRRQPPTPAHTPPLPPRDRGRRAAAHCDDDDDDDDDHDGAPLFRAITAVADHHHHHPSSSSSSSPAALHNALRACLASWQRETLGVLPDDAWSTPLLGGSPTTSPDSLDLVLVLVSGGGGGGDDDNDDDDDDADEDDNRHALLCRRLDGLAAAPHPATGQPCLGRLDLRYLQAQADLQLALGHTLSRARRLRPPLLPSSSDVQAASRLLAQLDLYRRASPAVRFVQLECSAARLGVARALQQLAGGVVEVVVATKRGAREPGRLVLPSTESDVKAFVEAVRRRLAAAGSATAAAYYQQRVQSPSPGGTVLSNSIPPTSRASAALSTATTAAATTTATTTATTPPTIPPRNRSPTAPRLVAKTIQVPGPSSSSSAVAAAQRRAAAAAAVTKAKTDKALIETDEADETGETGETDDNDNDSPDDPDDDLDDAEIRRLMPLYLRDRAALLAAKDAAGATRSWGHGGRGGGSSSSSKDAPRDPSSPSLPASRPRQSPTPTGSGGGSVRKSSHNNGQKARRWLGLA